MSDRPPREHRVLRMWIRAAKSAPPEERDALQLIEDEGVVDDHKRGAKRHVTLVFEDDWREATDELGRDVDPSGRRANVFLSGGGGGAWIGRTVGLGDAVVEIRGETKPCDIMNEAAPGLEAALGPNVRAGIWGVIRTGGTIRAGDALSAAD